MGTQVREVDRKIKFVEEVTLLGSIDERVVAVGTEGQTIVVGLAIVTAHDTFLAEVAEGDVVVHPIVSTADRNIVVDDGGIVVEDK